MLLAFFYKIQYSRMMKQLIYENVTLDTIVGGGQSLGTLADGRKAFVWGGLPGETVTLRVTKKKSHFIEGVVSHVITPVSWRTTPTDDSYLSTSPWQMMDFAHEQHYKAALIEEAFELHGVTLPHPIAIFTDNHQLHYRNKVEFSWYGATDPKTGAEILDLAFFVRGSSGKIAVDGTSLAIDAINQLGRAVRDALRAHHITARQLKTLLIRCDQQGRCTWQLYVKDKKPQYFTTAELAALPAQGGEVIYSDPKSPASRITERLLQTGTIVLSDTILGTPFRYATEGFFQVNLPIYEQALRDMQQWVLPKYHTVDLYSGVGTIGLTIGGDNCTLIEINEHAVREMKQNIALLHRHATAKLSASERALDMITSDDQVIVDPPRAGLHHDVIGAFLDKRPPRIIYLSCNPVTQARDIALLAERYRVIHHQGYNFFPRTPHIEHLVVLEKYS